MALSKSDNQAGKAYVGSNPIGKVYKGGTLIYTAEETIFSGVSVTAETTQGEPYQSRTSNSAKYTVNFSDWDTLSITGIYEYSMKMGGDHNVENTASLIATIGGKEYFLTTFYSGYDGGGHTNYINKSISISNYTGTGTIHLSVWLRNSNTYSTNGGKGTLSGMTCVLS